ncbi:MAG TPA: alpha/beta hydrolase [Caulobacteraceae bacterium]|nr:alpha/beta hydrolase [Caulobacteraceae bacterium]
MPLPPGPVAEAGFWRIGGVDQWVMIRGRSVDNPWLVILHGGPGSSETALFRAFNAVLEETFCVVYWDQRGAGRSYRKDIPEPSMTVERFVDDLDELIDRLLARFEARRVVLLGHSWGSALGVLYASRYPAKVAAYVGVGQVADMAASEAASYAFVLARAQERGRRRAVRRLLAIGPPPHTLEQIGVQRRWLMAMGGVLGPRLSLAKLAWRGLTSPEASPWDLVRMVQGSGFSLRLLWPELLAANLPRDVSRLEMPVFFLLGRLDMQVVSAVGAAYFEALEAPHKALVWFENSGHMVPFEDPDLFNRVMVDTVRPFAV